MLICIYSIRGNNSQLKMTESYTSENHTRTPETYNYQNVLSPNMSESIKLNLILRQHYLNL